MESRQRVKLGYVLCVWGIVGVHGEQREQFSVFNSLAWSYPFCYILRRLEQRERNKARRKWKGL